MHRTSRPSLYAACMALAVCSIAVPAIAQTYPVKPVRVIVPFPPSGAADILTRTLGLKLAEAWPQQLVVDNRPGAGEDVAKWGKVVRAAGIKAQ